MMKNKIKDWQREKFDNIDFCHNQITYLVVWPYCDTADNILPYFARHSLILGQAFPGIRLKHDLYYSIRSQEQSLRSHVALWRLSCVQLDRVSVRPKSGTPIFI